MLRKHKFDRLFDRKVKARLEVYLLILQILSIVVALFISGCT